MARVAKLLKNIFDLQNIGAAVKGMDKASTEINDKRFALRAQELAAKQKSFNESGKRTSLGSIINEIKKG